jgi:biopolymer transport protein ExbB/TolQ
MLYSFNRLPIIKVGVAMTSVILIGLTFALFFLLCPYVRRVLFWEGRIKRLKKRYPELLSTLESARKLSQEEDRKKFLNLWREFQAERFTEEMKEKSSFSEDKEDLAQIKEQEQDTLRQIKELVKQ